MANKKGEVPMLAGLLGLGVGAVVLAICLPLIQTAFVAPTTSTYDVTENLNLSFYSGGLNGTTQTMPSGGHYALVSATVKNATNSLPAADWSLDKTAKTISFNIHKIGTVYSNETDISNYDVTGTWTDSGYQSNAVNRTLAPFAIVFLLVAVIAMIAMTYL